MASDDMKKMLILIESCSCESNKEDTDEVTEGDEVDEMFFFPDTRSREEKSRAANEPQDILGRRPKQAIAKYGKEYKAMKKGTSAQDAADRERYGLGGPKGPLPENFEAFMESIREMAGGQLDELGDTFMGRMKLRALARRADKTDPGQDVAKRFNDTDADGRYSGQRDFDAQYRDSERRLSNVANAARERIANKGTDTAAIQQRNAQADLSQNTHDSSDHQFMRDKLNIDDPDYRVARFAKVAPMRPGQYGVSQRNTFRGKVPEPVKENELTQEDAEFQSFMETLNYVMRKK